MSAARRLAPVGRVQHSGVRTMTLGEFHDACRAQKVGASEDIAFVCPMCRTVQSARDLIAAGAGRDFDEVGRYLGYSCVGRFTSACPPRAKPDGEPCNWTLGGFLSMHTLEVVNTNGERHPHFELASPEDAQALAARHAAANAANDA